MRLLVRKLHQAGRAEAEERGKKEKMAFLKEVVFLAPGGVIWIRKKKTRRGKEGRG